MTFAIVVMIPNSARSRKAVETVSKLNELIARHCPDGAPYKSLKEISVMQRGTSVTKKSVKEGNIPVISGGKKPAYYCDQFNRDGSTITVSGSGANAGYVMYWDAPIFVCDAFSIKGMDGTSTKYIYYCLKKTQQEIHATKKGSGVPHVHISSIENFRIPLPPLLVQHEIARILDKLTAITTDLITALAAELAARRKQYEYYRAKQFTFSDETEWKTLGELCEILDKQRKPITKNYRISGIYPYYGANGIQDYVSDYLFDGTFLLMGEDGSVINRDNTPVLTWATGKIWVNNHAHVLKETDAALLRFIFFYLQTVDVSAIVRGAPPKINQQNMSKIKIPLPSLAEQRRIVDALNHFEAIYNDITKGLNAEIKARQQQYEYYLDKLLTFKVAN